MPSIHEQAVAYLEQHPYIKECLKKNLINYSKLSRYLASELGLKQQQSHNALLVACRRYQQQLKPQLAQDHKIFSLLAQSELEIKNKVMTVVIAKAAYLEKLLSIEKKIRAKADLFYAIEGTSAYTLITSEKYADEITQLFGYHVLTINTKLALLILKNPKEIETTPGVIAMLYTLFANHQVNIVETLSCWTDTLIVVKEEDIGKVMQFLRF
ncbi:MAG: hypothetical protein QW594_02545 [Candidatus Woesearchaeota archaeon]